MATTSSPDEALEAIARRAVEALNMTACVVYRYGRGESRFLSKTVFERSPAGRSRFGKPVPLTRYDGVWEQLAAGESLLERVSEPGLRGAARAAMKRREEKTSLTVPLIAESSLVGLLVLYDLDQERSLSDGEIMLARCLAVLAGQAMQAIRSLGRAEERQARLTSLLHANRAISASLDVDEVIDALAEHAVSALECDSCDMHSPEQLRNGVYCAPGNPAEEVQVVQQRLGDPGLTPEVLAEMMARGQGSRLLVPLPFGRAKLGTMVLSDHKADRVFTEADIDIARALAEQATLAVNNARRHKELRDVQLAGLGTLVGALGAKEPYTQGHAARVSQYVALIGAKLGWSEDVIGRAEEAAIMHDVGKLAVPDRILLKPGPLTDAEWRVIRAHPETSEEILHSMMQEDLLRAIRHHHERYDGRGYPDALRRDEIPLFARAICVADAYDAMSFRRPYRRPLTYQDCRAELVAGRGSQFDPQMVEAMLRVLDDLRRKRDYTTMVAREAAALIDAEKHKKLLGREDEDSEENREIAGILRGLLQKHDGIRYLTTMTRRASKFVFVVDAEESHRLKSRTGNQVLVPDDEMLEAYTGDTVFDKVALSSDEFGVWLSGFAPLLDHNGDTVALVCADSPPRSVVVDDVSSDQRMSLASLLGEAGKRMARAEFEAVTDGLTGVYNHRFLQEHVEEEISRATMHETSFAVLFIDIDHFKRFNDVWGHSVGDAALRAVAQVIQGEVRRGDVVARYGGEEFVAVLSETGQPSGSAIAERIRRRVARSVLVAGTSLVTVSIGVAVFPTDGRTRTLLLERGDAAMSRAKRLGRNRVQSYSSLLCSGAKGRLRKPR